MARLYDSEPPDLNGTIQQMQEQMLAYARDLRRVFGDERARRLELEDANRRLRDEARRRADLVSLLAHELRTPVTALVGYLELLCDGGFGALTSEQKAAADTLVRRSGDLARLVAELGQYAAIASEVTPARPAALGDLEDQLEQVCQPVRERAEEREIDLELTVEIGEPAARVDLALLSMAAAQLADNAVKFGRPGGRARVSARQQGDLLELVVEDDGPGLADSVREHLFEEFNVGDDLAIRPQGGLGLGLAIVAHAVRLLRAGIEIDDQPGSGTRVRLTIPLEQPVQA